MPIKASFMVPHPPLIIPEIGKGNEKQITKTINSYESVAQQIASIAPETIIISNPHAPYYSDYFYISSPKTIEGSFKNFGAKDVSFTEQIDEELVEEIEKCAKEYNFPAGITKEVELDHGSMVPLYFIKRKLPKCKIVIVGLSTLPLIDNYKMGMIINEAVNKLDRKVVFVASGDLSHKLQEYGPYGFVKEGPIYDKRIMDVCSNARFNELLEFDEEFLDTVAQCGHRSFTIMAGTMDGLGVNAKEYSHEDITGVGYGICSFYPDEENKDRYFYDKYLKEQEEKTLSNDELVNLAKKSIESYIVNDKILDMPNDISNELKDRKAGVFVSIYKFDRLRGCIGTFLPTTDCIGSEIIRNAISSCSKDPRFKPITKDELKYLKISVDVLKEPELVNSKVELDEKKYGVIVSAGYKKGLLLPDIKGIDSVDRQIEIAKKKGNINSDEEIILQRFEVVRHK